MDFSRVRELVGIVTESKVDELTVRSQGYTVTIRKRSSNVAYAVVQGELHQPLVEDQAETSEPPEVEQRLIPARSPAVGFVRLRLKEGAEAIVESGDQVSEGQILCLIESMNVPLEVHSPCAGRITAVAVQEGQTVEYGQPLIWIQQSVG